MPRSKPVIDGDFVRSADPNTGLGADDRAGAAAILSAALTIVRHKLPHPPLTFFWPIQEEVGLYGARHADVKLLGGPKLAFNWDGGTAEKVTLGATGGYRMQIDVCGLASHAGVAPELITVANTVAVVPRATERLDGSTALTRGLGASRYVHVPGSTTFPSSDLQVAANVSGVPGTALESVHV